MANLPLLVLEKIFSELTNLNEMIRCSGVCRNWRAAYEVYKPTTLCLYFGFMPLNYRLAYSTERMRRCEFFKTSEDLQFLTSEITRTHFANIRKLIILSPNFLYYDREYHPFSFRKQLNHFKKLEHLEFQRGVCLHLEDAEIDLPMLKVLCFNPDRFPDEEEREEPYDAETPKVVLHTPSLEVLEAQPRSRDYIKFSKFAFKFPHQLKSLTAILKYDGFKPRTKFEKLECLAVRMQDWDFKDNFLSFYPNLKLLLLFGSCDDRDEFEKKMMEQKKLFGLDDLEIIFNNTEDRDYTLDHENWRKYVKHEKTVRYCPPEFTVDFDQAIEHAVPLDLFKSFFRINILKLGNVTEQSPLLGLLRNAQTFHTLHFEPEFNLGVDFFNKVASFLTVHRLYFTRNVLNRLSDYTFLEKFNFSILHLKFKVSQKNLPREAASVALKKSNCQVGIQFDRKWPGESDSELSDESDREPSDENSRMVEGWGHFIERDPALGFVCVECKWDSTKDPDSDPIEATIKHAEKRWFYRLYY